MKRLVAAAGRADSMTKTSFTAASNGFAFANLWTFDDVESAQVRSLLAAAVNGALVALNPLIMTPLVLMGLGRTLSARIASGLPQTYGLCGGMAFASLDYFKRGIPCPRGGGPSDQPTRKTPRGATLRDYLWHRLIHSLMVGGAAVNTLSYMGAFRLMPRRWPFKGGPSWLLARSKEHWEVLKGHIDAGDPWPIGLVGETTDPFENHQVVAYGYEQNADAKGTIYLYDMNCPGSEQTIELDFSGEELVARESCPGTRGTLRGFFCEIYSPESPPRLE